MAGRSIWCVSEHEAVHRRRRRRVGRHPAAPVAPARQPVSPGRDPDRRTRSRPSTGRRSGSCPRSGWRCWATGRSMPSRRAGASVDRGVAERAAGAGAGRGARRAGPAASSGCTPGTRSGTCVFGGANLVFCAVGGPAFVSDLDRGRRPGNIADFRDYVRLIGALDVIHQEGGGPLEPTDLPVETRHLDQYRIFATELDKTWHCLGTGRVVVDDALEVACLLRGVSRDDLAARAVADHDHQHELAAPARRPDERRADRDGAARPAGGGDAVHAGRRDEPGVAGRRDRATERRGAVHGRAGPDRPAGRADGLRRVHLERRHADGVAGVRDARVGEVAVRHRGRWRGGTGCRGDRRTRPRHRWSTRRRPTRPRWPCGAR